jgi:hypothetical protein
MLKKLHRPSLYVVNLVGNQKQKTLLKNEEHFTATQHHKPANHAPEKSVRSKPQKSHTQL